MNNGIFIFIVFLGIFLGSIGFPSKFKNFSFSKSKYGKLYKWSIIFLIFGCLITFMYGAKIIINKVNFNDSSSVYSPADGFTIEGYKIVMNVSETNSVDVKEYINVDFYEGGHHGIYKFIPYWLEYTDKTGTTKSRRSTIKNLRAVGENYTLDVVNGKERIKIGDSNKTIPKGIYNYEIDYTYDMGSDPYNDFDEFIFHAFGDFWGTEIKNALLIINLPKSFDVQNKIKFYADKYRRQDITSYVDYYVSGNTIYANLSSDYKLNNSLTIDLVLPDGYFVQGSNNYGIVSLILCSICIIFMVIMIILWKKYGKDLNKISETVEFYPPENLDAAEIGYLFKKDVGIKLSVALIVELASKGLIKIVDSYDKSKLTIIKTNNNDFNTNIKREIKIVKLKEYDYHLFDTHINVSKLMSDYFPNNTTENIITRDFDKFYDDSKCLVDNGYIKIVSDNIDQYSQEQINSLKKELSLNETKDKEKMSSNEEIVYKYLFADSNETILSENKNFYKSFGEIAENLKNKFDDKINDLTSSKYMLITSIGLLTCIILWGLSYFKFEDLNPSFNILYIISFVSNIFSLIFVILMKRKNLYGEQITAKINGFKRYLEMAEKNQLEMLVEQNPNYYYDILPYAYVLNVSKKWIKKFENIPLPTNMGDLNYDNIDLLDNLSYSVITNSLSSSSSGSSSSGGCSSCGGGCSSCGGGGSW